MGKTKIEWANFTFNPWWGCVRVSPACEHCYAESFSKRVGQKVWGVDAPRRFFGDAHWHEPLKWNRVAERTGVRARVFCASMADVFEDRRDLDEHRHRLWDLIHLTPLLDWLLLTKRPEHFDKLAPGPWVEGRCPPHVQVGVTAENQKYWDLRVPMLRRIPVLTRFVSVEPLLSPIEPDSLVGIHQLIVGGESGHGARPMHPDWVRTLRDACQAAGVAYFFKQWGQFVDPHEIRHAGYDDVVMSERATYVGSAEMWSVGKKAAGRLLDGREWNELPLNVVATRTEPGV